MLPVALMVLCSISVPPGEAPSPALAEARSWVYQLQKVDLDALSQVDADVIVMDTVADDGKPWTPEQLERLRARPGGQPRVVLAYLSIGEAEDYRPYWQATWKKQRPRWIGRPNPDWPGNYPVKFWVDPWREIVLGPQGLVEVAMASGFDGLYLDRLDIYEVWGPTGRGAAHSEVSGLAMVQFVDAIAKKARSLRPRALVVPQNASALYAEPILLDCINAVALEDVFFLGAKAQPKAHTAQVFANLIPIFERKLPVFSVDYTKARLRPTFIERARTAGLIPYAAPSLALDRLPDPPPTPK